MLGRRKIYPLLSDITGKFNYVFNIEYRAAL